MKSYEEDDHAQEIIIQLIFRPSRLPICQWTVKISSRIYIGDKKSLKEKILQELHNEACLGQSGIPATYRKDFTLFLLAKEGIH